MYRKHSDLYIYIFDHFIQAVFITTNHDLSIGVTLVFQHHTPDSVWLFNGDLSDPGMVGVNS